MMNSDKRPVDGKGVPDKRRCVYTVLLGGYETLNEQDQAAGSEIPFICLTDDPDLRSDSWLVRLVRPHFPGDPVRSQRMLKIMAHTVLPEFDESLYIDNTVMLAAPPEAIFERYSGEAPMALFSHSFRDRLCDEFEVVAKDGIDVSEQLAEQRAHYESADPEILKQGALWTGILLRCHADPLVRKMADIWCAHVLRYSMRDQLSINVALREAGLAPLVIEEDNHRSWFHTWPHKTLRKSGLPVGQRGTAVKRLEMTLKQRDAEIQRLQAQLASSRVEAQAFRSSTSWRITAPMRATVTAVRAGFARLRAPRHRSGPAIVYPRNQSASDPASMADFARDGFFGPVPLFTREQCQLIMRHYRMGAPEPSPEWPKDRAVIDPFFHDLAMQPAILDRLGPLLGGDIVIWGASVVVRKPGQVHLVHTDIESSAPEGGFVSVWVGLEGTSQASALAMITRSQGFGMPVQQVMMERGLNRKTTANETILDLARERDRDAAFVQPAMGDGDALFIDGRVWHGSSNTGTATRTALLLQYARAGVDVPIQRTGQSDWPFEMSGRMAACLPVLTNGRSAAGQPVPPHGQSPVGSVVSQNAGLTAGPAGFSPFHILRGATPNAPDMESHVSVLDPGHSPHPPHCHVEEELLVVLDGEAEIVIPTSPHDDAPRTERLTAGGIVYYPAYQYHTIRNVSPRPVTYVMLKWRGAPKQTDNHLATTVLHIGDVASSDQPISMPKLLEGPTGFLSKLHAHVTVMAPGAGYPAHVDEHDVAIIVFEGEVETVGHRIGPGGTAFSAAGDAHGLSNPGAVPARYLVFEFHA